MDCDPVKLFISYSHKDEALRDEFKAHLSPLMREKLIDVWHDRKIGAGATWESEISARLSEAEVVIFLLSPDFFASEYCYGQELSKALEFHAEGRCLVVPIVIRPVEWGQSKLAAIQALPRDARPITVGDNRDLAWLNVISGLRDVCARAIEKRDVPSEKAASQLIGFSQLLSDVLDDIQCLYDREEPSQITGIPTGLQDIDAVTEGLHFGQVSVLASAPALDREGMLVRIVSHAGVELKLPVAFVCACLDKKYAANRLLACTAHVSVGRMRRGLLRDEDWDRLTVGLGKSFDAPITVIPAIKKSIDEVIKLLEKLANELGALPVVVIDSLAHFVEDKATVVRRLREYVSNRQRTVLAGVGLEVDPSNRVDPRPRIQDVGSWASLNEDIDCLMLLYSDEIYHPDTLDVGIREIIVPRSRSGSCGAVRVAYIADSQRYENLAY